VDFFIYSKCADNAVNSHSKKCLKKNQPKLVLLFEICAGQTAHSVLLQFAIHYMIGSHLSQASPLAIMRRPINLKLISLPFLIFVNEFKVIFYAS
jgi:hypothetical protein